MDFGFIQAGARYLQDGAHPVVCDESGHIKFPFSYLAHVTLLTLAQARLSCCSGFAQVGSPLLTLITIFGKLRRSLRTTSTLAKGDPELVPYIKMARMCPIFEPNSLRVFILVSLSARDLSRSLFSKPRLGCCTSMAWFPGARRCQAEDEDVGKAMRLSSTARGDFPSSPRQV